MQAAIVSLLRGFRFGMLDRRLISVDGKPVKACSNRICCRMMHRPH